MKNLFLLGFWSILVLGFLLRILPLNNNNFFFTMDQGNDAVYVREILMNHKIFLLGPETGIDGLFAGPLWYYFIAVGFALFDGHPIGSVFMLILLNVALIGILMWKIKQKISHRWALMVGFALLTSWWFYDVSRYGFNPFPLVFLAFWLILSLVDFLEGHERSFVFAAIPIGLGFNTEMAGSIAFLLFYLVIGFWAIVKRKISWKSLLVAGLIIFIFLLPHYVSELQTNFSQAKTLMKEIYDPNGIFSERNFDVLTPVILKIISRSIWRQIPEMGFFIFTILVFLFFKKWGTQPKINQFTKRFVGLTIILLIVSWLWFSSNTGWQTWQTVYLSPLIFVSFLLILHELKRWLVFSILALSLISHFLIFQTRYSQYWQPSNDVSLLHNELAAIDWVYQNAEGQGFYVYNYLPSVYDYPYQYLFWWYGLKKYGYLPCEYASYPGAPKIFIPGEKNYRLPQRPCSNLRFLIVEPDKNTFVRQQWLDGVQTKTILLEKSSAGNINLEKRKIIK